MSLSDDNIQGISHNGIAVTDMEVSLRFYRDGLGLQVYIDRIANHDYLREVTAVPSSEVRIVIRSTLTSMSPSSPRWVSIAISCASMSRGSTVRATSL